MERDLYRYSFDDKIPMGEAEESLMLAVLATECIHGHSALRLASAFLFDPAKRSCVIDGSTEIGRHIAAIFTGFLGKQFGDESFRVERIAKHREAL